MTFQIGKQSTAAKQLWDAIVDEGDINYQQFTTPLAKVNNLFGGGLRPGEVTVLAGSVGSAKSYLSLMLCLHCHQRGIQFAYMPLEDTAGYALRRLWSLNKCDWAIMKFDKATADERLLKATEEKQLLDELQTGLFENPRLPVILPTGQKYNPALPWQLVSEWISRVAPIFKLIVIDPISMIDFSDFARKVPEFEGQQAFVREVVAIAKSNKAHIWMVAHLAKRQGRTGLPTMDDVQGSTAFARFADNVLLLSGHEPTKSRVLRYAECEDEVEHKRTLVIGKVRNGPGTGARIAIDFSSSGPVLTEFGVILPKKKKDD